MDRSDKEEGCVPDQYFQATSASTTLHVLR